MGALQECPGFDAELLPQVPLRALVRIDGVRSATEGMERHHELSPGGLAQWLLAGELEQRFDHVRLTVEGERDVGPTLLQLHSPLGQAGQVLPPQRLRVDIGQREPTPQLQRLAEGGQLRGEVIAACCLVRPTPEPIDQTHIGVLARDV